VFSINAVGIMKGYKRETRLRVVMVVDFRNAPNLTQGSATPGSPTGTTPTAGAPAASPTAVPSASATSIVQPASAGNAIYFRID
jgi:hypothetical protein